MLGNASNLRLRVQIKPPTNNSSSLLRSPSRVWWSPSRRSLSSSCHPRPRSPRSRTSAHCSSTPAGSRARPPPGTRRGAPKQQRLLFEWPRGAGAAKRSCASRRTRAASERGKDRLQIHATVARSMPRFPLQRQAEPCRRRMPRADNPPSFCRALRQQLYSFADGLRVHIGEDKPP